MKVNHNFDTEEKNKEDEENEEAKRNELGSPKVDLPYT